jgi:hypothetical protein
MRSFLLRIMTLIGDDRVGSRRVTTIGDDGLQRGER